MNEEKKITQGSGEEFETPQSKEVDAPDPDSSPQDKIWDSEDNIILGEN
ncbi:MAG: hypothetical protein U5K77_02665 [Candidatus Saccharibacteria bacterium]|nr:hypothetical protein [Candidatus Saccharibacteria bacterium]